MITPNDVRAHYQKMQDSQIIEIARNPQGLRKEIVPVLKEEIRRRGLDPGLIAWVTDVHHEYRGLELAQLKRTISKSPCPVCGSRDGITGTEHSRVTSYLILSEIENRKLLVCSRCARNMIHKNMLYTFLFGWWSKRGIFYTPFYLIKNVYNLFFPEKTKLSVIEDFIKNNVGNLRRIKSDAELRNLIISYNDRQYVRVPTGQL